MATVAMVAGDQGLPNTTTYASWGTAGLARAFLAADFSEDAVVRFESTGTSSRIEVLDSRGRRLGFVGPKQAAYVVLRQTTDEWVMDAKQHDFPAFNAACPAGGTGAAAGGWDTAGNRDSAITLINAMRTALINAGLMKAE